MFLMDRYYIVCSAVVLFLSTIVSVVSLVCSRSFCKTSKLTNYEWLGYFQTHNTEIFLYQTWNNIFLFRSSHWGCSIKKLFLKISQYSQENTCTGVSFLINFNSKEATTQVFSYIAKFLRTNILRNICERLDLLILSKVWSL